MSALATLDELIAENAALKAKLGLNGDGAPSRASLFVTIARSLLLPDDAVLDVKKYGHEESSVRITLQFDGNMRHLDCPVKKLVQVTFARGLIADVCDQVITYRQTEWTKIVNFILSAAQKVAGYERDTETIEWVTAFAQRACSGLHGQSYARRIRDGADIYDRIISIRGRRAGVLEASHTAELFFVRRPDDGISFGQADFMGFVWIQMGYRLNRGELDQRLTTIGFNKAPLSARKASQVTKLKAVWHSPPGWLQDHDCDLPDAAPSRRVDHNTRSIEEIVH